MAEGFLGRDITLQWGGNSPADIILGVREKGIEISGEPVDMTSDDDDGWRKLHTEAGQKEVTISLSGVTKDNRLKQDWFGNRATQPVTLTYPDGARITGNFFLSSYSETGTYNDATTFEAEVQSTGIVLFSGGA